MNSKLLNNCLLACVIIFFLAVPLDAFEEPIAYSDSHFAAALSVKELYKKDLMSFQGVKGVGIGEKDGQLAIAVLIDKENPEPPLPSQVGNMPIIIKKVGKIKAYQVELGTRLSNGIVCGGYCAVGTIGFKVCDNTDPGIVGWISNNHVLTAGCPDLCPNIAGEGTTMFSPGCSGINIGSLERFIPIYSNRSNLVDAGFVTSSNSLISSYIQGLDYQSNHVASPFPGQVVLKSGATTGVTQGRIEVVDVDNVHVGLCENEIAEFDNQIMIEMLADHGDSGAPIVDVDNNAVALLLGGDGQYVFANPIQVILDTLNVSLCECYLDEDCDDEVNCTDDTCENNTCINSPNNENCPDDGLYCTGEEYCDPGNGCLSSGDPCSSLELDCDEVTNSCDGTDGDNDGIFDNEDNCPDNYNPEQEDSYPESGNNCGDACECEGNFNPDIDDDVDGSDASVFKADFGRGGYNNPCEIGNHCNGDFDCDSDVDGSDSAVFKADFGRGGYNESCPNCHTTDPWCTY